MSEKFIGEIRMFGGNFAPAGWALCQGQLLAISSNDALFSLLGTMYGGDGRTTFGLPDFRGRLPIHHGSDFVLGAKGGSEQVTVTNAEMPAHTHPMFATDDIPTLSNPENNIPGQAAAKFYRAGNPSVSLNSGALSSVGGSQPHNNLQPFLCVNFIIALFGVYPSRS